MNLYVVTGATRGLGAALAERIAAQPENELVTMSRSASPGGHSILVDFAHGDAVHRAGDALCAHIAGKTYARAVLINNAGVVSPVGPLDEIDGDALQANLQVNLIAPMLLMQAFLRSTAHVPLRRIINISSGAGRRPIFGWSGYCAAKAGLDMASRVVALECETRGMAVEVVSLAPGVIDTGMQEVVRGARVEQFVDVERFRAMKEQGVLRPAADVAADILRLEASGALKGDAVQDLRELA